MEKTKEIIKAENNSVLKTTVGEYQNQLLIYLDDLGLPKENVLVDVNQRGRVIQNVPMILESMNPAKIKESFYISKFIAACGSGLFDAALNYIWNETIESLREKVGLFDLDYFKSTISDESKKDKIRTIEDLNLIDEWELVRGCHITGIITDIGFKHLDYIRDMRNWASAAHPNQVQLTGLQLSNWLETCIIEVIGKEPSLPAVQARQLLENIRNNILTVEDIPHIQAALRQAPCDIIISIFRTIFGMFCDPSIKVEIKNNIRLLANDIWEVLPENQRKEAGIKFANWSANANIPKKELAKEFLEQVDALSYLPAEALIVEMANIINFLQKAHFGLNNFYNEPPYSKLLKKLVPENGIIPDSIRFEYVKTLTLCMIGNGYGTSILAYPTYSELFSKFTDNEIKVFIALFSDTDFSSRMQFRKCKDTYLNLCDIVETRTSDESIKRVINHIKSQSKSQLPMLGRASEYKRLISLLA